MNMLNQWPARLAPAGLALALLTGCTTLGESPRVVVGMSDGVLATDPASGYDPGSWLLFNNVFQSLLSFPAGGTEPEPDAADTCSFTDGHAKTYTCVLKDGLRFSNGDPLTSQDVKFSFDRTVRINDPAGPAVMFGSLDRIETPDERTVIFKLKVPDATFPSKIASGAGSIVDHRQYDPRELRTDGAAVGSGPYKLDHFSKGEAVFSVNEHYKGNARVKNSGVRLRFFHGDQDALQRALVDGRVDIAYRGLTALDISDLSLQIGHRDVEVVEGSSAEVQHLVFDMRDPVAGRLSVRRAIAHVLDRDALVKEVYRDTAIPLYSIVPAGIGGHTTAFFDRYGGRPSREAAAAVLRADGITGKVRLTLWSTPVRYGPATDQEMRAIAAQLNASGLFDADVKSVRFDRYERDIAAGRYGVYVKGWVPDYPDADNFTAPFFGKGNVLGNHYENRTVTDELIPSTAAESHREDADEAFGELQDIVAREIPVLPVWQAKQYAVVRDGVHGVDYCLDPSTVFRFWEISKD
ncbi:ABC transporter substrate-binding protein [Streptomyces cinerochromogenes]|uniref:ABC transporter substrate-binding protein n=1 Tax=Streptomyces cinerochromogenes TaxID=66422 RepID=UPI0016712287|nr:ABC transporter substrate-binding protein [Streptomyces cinerochromogenes]GGT00009.1 solute-binding transport lipoprotein [Streptomyces cinerochromogenes]